jgi:hypothetical protein
MAKELLLDLNIGYYALRLNIAREWCAIDTKRLVAAI